MQWWCGREARQRPAKPFTRVRIPSPPRLATKHWAIGAAVARFPDTEEVTGSNPVSPTMLWSRVGSEVRDAKHSPRARVPGAIRRSCGDLPVLCRQRSRRPGCCGDNVGGRVGCHCPVGASLRRRPLRSSLRGDASALGLRMHRLFSRKLDLL